MKQIKMILGLIALSVVLTACSKDEGGENNSGTAEISTFDFKNGVSALALYDAPNTRAWHIEIDEAGNTYEWFDGPVVIQIDSEGKAVPVISFSHDGRPIEWYCKSITYLTSNYVLFETDREKSYLLAPYYLVRISDGKAFNFSDFDYSEITEIEDNYLYLYNANIDDGSSSVNSDKPVAGIGYLEIARLYLPESGNIEFEEFIFKAEQFTKNYIIGGSPYNNIVMDKRSRQSFTVPNGYRIIGVDYDKDRFYYTDYENSEEIIEGEIANGKLSEVERFEIPLYLGQVRCLFPKNEELVLITETNTGVYNRDTEKYAVLSEDIYWTGPRVERLHPRKFTITTLTNELYVLDLNAKPLLYGLMNPDDYPQYYIQDINYLNPSDRFSINALRLADSKKVLLSMDVMTDGMLVEVEEYDNTILEIVPIN
ncbi:MAG: hypothetical protein LUF87_06170 [Alistipes sp.]|nr:hypothetical protein [Alistipes sp.]